MREYVTIFLIVIFFVCWPCGLDARETKGNQIDVYFKNGEIMMGELIGVNSDCLMVLEFYTPEATRVDINDVQFIDIAKQSRADIGILIGGAIGVAGAVGVYKFAESSDWDLGTGLLAISVPPILGAFLGGLIGSASSKDVRIYLEDKSESEIQMGLDRLRKYARIPDYR